MRIVQRAEIARDLERRLLPELRETVFHVTSLPAFALIRRDGEIRHNRDGKLPHTSDWSKRSSFREWGYVSLCDLRGLTDEELRLGLDRYPFLNPHPNLSDPVFLFLARDAWPRLLTYSAVMTRNPPPGHVVPYVESGYPEAIPLDLIDEAWVVSLCPAHRV